VGVELEGPRPTFPCLSISFHICNTAQRVRGKFAGAWKIERQLQCGFGRVRRNMAEQQYVGDFTLELNVALYRVS
jgi:hypothetical protein